ncbi:hypothetical protein [Simiduia agarivorans]|uniref:Lipoprotein n=1 Tax=Simiduia agarivorans (strain DSM 21679 / JCM 13881 / BCRC 17597 / SA1) TaxID=1117647 RepID=K4KRQ8_SIMAS|nr:hypothetical protein [Simiduia agarivorans]AFV00839.1 hypothetical protein M5M_18550 [Simiduia agarivorans SA1 = DSM 21679]
MGRLIGTVFFLLSFAVAGCSAIHRAEEAVADIEQGVEMTPAYALTEAQARTVVLSAFRDGWPDKTPEPLAQETLGYEIMLHFVIDRERLIVEVMPEADAVAFRVTNRGTAPVVGVPAREKMVQLIRQKAAQAAGTAL